MLYRKVSHEDFRNALALRSGKVFTDEAIVELYKYYNPEDPYDNDFQDFVPSQIYDKWAEYDEVQFWKKYAPIYIGCGPMWGAEGMPNIPVWEMVEWLFNEMIADKDGRDVIEVRISDDIYHYLVERFVDDDE